MRCAFGRHDLVLQSVTSLRYGIERTFRCARCHRETTDFTREVWPKSPS